MDELVEFLQVDSPVLAKEKAIAYVLGFTATDDGKQLLTDNFEFLKCIAVLVQEEPNSVLRGKSYEVILNASSEEIFALRLLKECDGLLEACVMESLKVTNKNVLRACAILSNLSQTKECCEIIWNKLEKGHADMLLDAFCQGNDKDILQDHISFLFSNLTMLSSVRAWMLDHDKKRIEKFFPFMTLETTATRKHGSIGVIRNCMFDTQHHIWLLKEVEILSRLLFPLIGPEVETNLDEEDMEQLPIDCQYLGTEKKMEENVEIKKMLIEGLHQLCATREGRKYLKDHGAYFVMRELHKVEQDKTVVIACENLVDILIADEPEQDNLKEIEIPEDLVEKFKKMDNDMLKED